MLHYLAVRGGGGRNLTGGQGSALTERHPYIEYIFPLLYLLYIIIVKDGGLESDNECFINLPRTGKKPM